MRKSDSLDAVLGRRGQIVILLAFILMLNGLDTVGLGLVMQNIKETLRLTDSQLGFLTGIAFTLFYSTIGVPIGRWADRGNRAMIIALATGLWSIMVMLVGTARTFAQLLLIRVGVAIGESGCMPASYSLISDLYARDERPKAIGNYLLGGSLSVIVGYILAGLISHWYGWRWMFILFGLPGIVVAPIAWWLLDEPRKCRGSSAAVIRAEAPPVAEVGRMILRNKTFRRLLAMSCIAAFFGSGIFTWQPSFYERSFNVKPEELGFILALVYGVAGFAGTFFGGRVASRFARSNERLQLKSLAVLNIVFSIIMAMACLTNRLYVSFALSGLGVLGTGLQAGPLFSTLQTVVPERMRAVTVSIQYLFVNLVGAGLGPLLVGTISDALVGHLGKESLRYALLAMSPGFLWGAWQLWRASQTVFADMESVSLMNECVSSECSMATH